MTTFTMTKLIVSDLARAKAFYEAAAGLSEARRIKGAVDGRPITELIMAGPAGAATLVLFTFHDAPEPQTGECMLVFETDDIAAFMARAVAAGASVMQPVQSLPEFGLSFGFVRDPEGHIVEAIQRSV